MWAAFEVAVLGSPDGPLLFSGPKVLFPVLNLMSRRQNESSPSLWPPDPKGEWRHFVAFPHFPVEED